MTSITSSHNTPDAEPEKGFFYRSDHFAFAKMGVPSLYVDGGIDVRGKNKKYGCSTSI